MTLPDIKLDDQIRIIRETYTFKLNDILYVTRGPNYHGEFRVSRRGALVDHGLHLGDRGNIWSLVTTSDREESRLVTDIKVGDRVRVIDGTPFFEVGTDFTVGRVDEDGDVWEKNGNCIAACQIMRLADPLPARKESKPEAYHMLPWKALDAVARQYNAGAKKYPGESTKDPYQWRKGYEWSKSFDALIRHAGEFWEGEDNDAETGEPHMAAVVFHALTLIQRMIDGRQWDDRPNTRSET